MQNIYTQQNTSILLEKLRSIFNWKNVKMAFVVFGFKIYNICLWRVKSVTSPLLRNKSIYIFNF